MKGIVNLLNLLLIYLFFSSFAFAAETQINVSNTSTTQPKSSAKSHNQLTHNLLILGDSLSAGYRVPVEKSWPVLLNTQWQSLRQAGNEMPNVINGSISGDTAAQAAERLPNLLAEFKPKWVLIELGANNGLQGLETQALKTDLTAIIQTIKNANAVPILMQIRIPPNYGKRYSDAFAAIYPALSESESVVLVPFFMEPVVEENSQHHYEWIQDDGIHPSEAAQSFIAQWMHKQLLPIVFKK